MKKENVYFKNCNLVWLLILESTKVKVECMKKKWVEKQQD